MEIGAGMTILKTICSTFVANRYEMMIYERRSEAMTSVLKVRGMSCQHCVMAVTKALNQLEGVQKVEVDLPKGEVRFENTKAVAQDEIEKAIGKAGFQVV
jgi:copper ion binding protein